MRFAARFRYAIEASTFTRNSEIAPAISTRYLPSAIRDELTKILTEGAARRGFELLDETRLLCRSFCRKLPAMKGVEQPPQFHPEGDVWTHTLHHDRRLAAGCSPTLAWGVLLHDVGKPPTFTPPSGPDGRIRFDQHVEVGTRMAEEICRRLRFSNDDTRRSSRWSPTTCDSRTCPQMKPPR